MNNFEKIAASPDKLGAFLASLPVIEGPWDTAFQRQYCSGCGKVNCDACPNEQYRNNPVWWLALEAGKERDA